MRIGVMLKAGVPLAAVLSLVFASASSAAPTAPFTQCPAVGYDTSCQLLVDFGSNGTATVLTDPSQIAFDGVEDTLIGVQNDSPVTINSFTVTSTSSPPPFEFEGDGACSGINSSLGLGTFNPPPAGCPFGATGYEGPGVTYSGISSGLNTGTINFTPGIAPGKSGWFSLEGPVTANSVTIPPPPMVTITTPADGATYPEGSTVDANYTCTDGAGGPGIATCTGPVANGSPIDTSSPGKQCFTVTATSTDGESTSKTNCYTIVAPTYTGDAYNLKASASLLGVVKLSPLTLNEIGPVATTDATNNQNTIVTESLPLLGLTGGQLFSGVVTGSDVSTATTSTNGLSLLGLPLGAPAISTGEVQSSSQTVCTASTGTISSTGSTAIAFLKIGNLSIKIPNSIPANDTISLGPLGSVTLNEQKPIKNGLAVNAIDIKLLTRLGLGSVHVIIGHAESDIDGC